jgi:predicted aspartyl protease
MGRAMGLAAISIFALLAMSGAAPADAPMAASPPAATPPANACKLMRITELDLTTFPGGSIGVPAMVDDRPIMLVVDTGDIHTVVSSIVADDLHLTRDLSAQTQVLLGGVEMSQIAYSHSFKLGTLTTGRIGLIVAPAQALESDSDGLLGPDIMSNYDVEIDYAHAKLSLFSQDHCPGEVVYWTKDAYAQIPMHVDDSWHITVNVTLDGKVLNAAIDTGAERSTMSLSVAKEIFGIDEKNPALSKRANALLNNVVHTTFYRYPFSALTLEGIAVAHPDIDILPEDAYGKGGPQLIVGASVLRQLHLYIAYKEQVLYATPAEAK